MDFVIDNGVIEDVNKAASIVASRFPGKFDREDVAQAIYLDILKNTGGYENAAGKGGAVLFSAYKRAGFRYCQIEKNSYLHFSDQHMYSTEEIKKILPDYFRALGDVAEFEESRVGISNLVIDFMTLDVAFSHLRKSHKEVLAKRYYQEEPLTRSEQNAHSKAIRFLAGYVNESVYKQNGYDTYLHEGPKVGGRPSANSGGVEEKEWKPGADAMTKYQRLMEAMH